MNPDLVFPPSEFAARLAKLRERIASAGADVLLTHIPENIYYLTGYRTPGYYMYQCLTVPVEGDPVIVVRHLEATNVTGLSYVRDCVSYGDTEDPVDVCLGALRERGMLRGTVGIEMDAWFLSPGRCRHIVDAVGESAIADLSGTVEELRLIKSPHELDVIRQAAAIANAGMTTALEMIAPGVTEDEIAAEVLAVTTRMGCDYTSCPPFITSGSRSWLAHSTWEGRTLEEGDAVYLEISGNVKRYSGALMRTAFAGRASDRHRRIAGTIIEGLQAGIEQMRPGNTAGDVDRACRSVFERDGIAEHFRHRTGYSIGISFPPDWGEGHIASLRRGDPRVLEPGMVFHAPPGVLIEGEVGIGFSDTVIIGDNGPEPLATVPLRVHESAGREVAAG